MCAYIRLKCFVWAALSHRPDQQPAASEAAQAAVGGQGVRARLAADARGVAGPARAGGPRGLALPHALLRRRALGAPNARGSGALTGVSALLLLIQRPSWPGEIFE